MLKEIFLLILGIIIITGMGFNEGVYAGGTACNSAQLKQNCTNVHISYEHDADLEWTANMWYTPCGESKEAAFPFYARDWDNNVACVQRGTRVRIGAQGLANSYVDEMATGTDLNVECRGWMGADGVDHACCRDTSVPLPPCTTVTVSYEPDTHWEAMITYMPCSKCAPVGETSIGVYFPETVSVTSGTTIKVGPFASSNYYVNKQVSGSQVDVKCGGSGKDATCCVVGSPGCSFKTSKKDKVKPSSPPSSKRK